MGIGWKNLEALNGKNKDYFEETVGENMDISGMGSKRREESYRQSFHDLRKIFV